MAFFSVCKAIGRVMIGLLAFSGACDLAAQPRDVTPRAGSASRPAVTLPGRIALVVGNGAYTNSPLLNAVNDARAVAQALELVGFEVALHTESTQAQMARAARDFGERLQAGGPDAVGIFYYAGHGMQIKGRNYLIPVGADIAQEDEVAYRSLDAQSVLDTMTAAGSGTNLMILDSCRDNPFARNSRSLRGGMAQMDASAGALIAFATAPGSVAGDGRRGGHGLYTSHLLAAMKRPGLKVEDVFKLVRIGVLRDSNGRQQPWESSALTGDFYFAPSALLSSEPQPVLGPPMTPAASGALTTQDLIEDALWQVLGEGASVRELRAYLGRFPSGRHAAAARDRLIARGANAEPSLSGNSAQTSRRRVEEIARWGEEHTDQRPPVPQRNLQGLAVGDRWRYKVHDLWRDEPAEPELLRLDQVEESGQLKFNEGLVIADVWGQPLRSVNARTGEFEEWSAPLPVAEVALRGVGHEREVSGTQRTRSGSLTTTFSYSGTVRASSSEFVTTEAGTFEAVRVEVRLRGAAIVLDSTMTVPGRHYLIWSRTYWFTPEMRLPLALVIDERGGHVTMRRRVRYELIAADVLAAGGVFPPQR